MQMPFGKHAGKELADIPRAYLVWALENLELHEDLRAEISKIVKAGNGKRAVAKKETTPAPDQLVEAVNRLADVVDRLASEIKQQTFYGG